MDEYILTLPLKKVWSPEARQAAIEARRRANERRRQSNQPAIGRPQESPPPTPPAPSTQATPASRTLTPRERRKQASTERHRQELLGYARGRFQARYGVAPNADEEGWMRERAESISDHRRLTQTEYNMMDTRVRSFAYSGSPFYSSRLANPSLNFSTTRRSTGSTPQPASLSVTPHPREAEYKDNHFEVSAIKPYEEIMSSKGAIPPSPEEFNKAMTGGYTAPSFRVHSYSRGNVEFTWSGRLRDEKGEPLATSLTRTFTKHPNGTFEVHHDYFEVVPKHQASGTAKKVLASQMEMYRKVGVDEVTVYADIDVGRYAWAKYGFLPSQDGWNHLRENYKYDLDNTYARHLTGPQLDSVRRILDNPDPRSIWALSDVDTKIPGPAGTKPKTLPQLMMTKGDSWSGTLKMNNREQGSRFDDYVHKTK